jgi:hypothetical protein
VMSMHDSALIEFFIVISTIAEIVGLFVLHLRFREAAK